MNKDLIIIIPTKGRQHYLNRVAYYYSKFDMHTYICDAYQTRCDIDSYDNVHYLWDSSKGFFEEMLDVINNTDSKYCILSPDDDFIKYETCMECYGEMENDKNILIGSGKQLFFNEDYNGNFIYYSSLNRLAGLKKQKFGRDDNKLFWRGYQNIHWSIFRRDFILNVLERLMKVGYKNANFTELTMGLEALLNGYIYISNDYFNYREESYKPHWGTIAKVPNWKNFILSSELQSDLKIMKDLYKDDHNYVLHSLYYFLGNPFAKVKQKMTRRFFPCSFEDKRVIVVDEIMDKRIREALCKMRQEP